MPRLVAAFLVLCTPAWAAPAQRQPRPDAIQSGAEAVPAGRADTAADLGKLSKGSGEAVARSKTWSRKVKKSLGGVCRGC
ncbi:hypothetical protein GMJLKIPL_6429 [Methylobacterium isbiliense]|uniref:Uncharacterized protein n=1 Tax=Methylobacterium isbiliense TaxID=315478 RepID=A0ABQ4SPN8_9HYPH|nr:hypothetical protein GMJLKIPL_6429 [Methylobacterium isbiliense]